PDPDLGPPGAGHPRSDPVPAAHPARTRPRDPERSHSDRDGAGLEAATAVLASTDGNRVNRRGGLWAVCRCPVTRRHQDDPSGYRAWDTCGASRKDAAQRSFLSFETQYTFWL